MQIHALLHQAVHCDLSQTRELRCKAPIQVSPCSSSEEQGAAFIGEARGGRRWVGCFHFTPDWLWQRCSEAPWHSDDTCRVLNPRTSGKPSVAPNWLHFRCGRQKVHSLNLWSVFETNFVVGLFSQMDTGHKSNRSGKYSVWRFRSD